MAIASFEVEGWRQGPTVFAIAWIPQPFQHGKIPAGLWNHSYWYTWCGMLLTGNRRPPRKFCCLEHLKRFISRKGYRGILGYHSMRIRPPHGAENQYQSEGKLIRVTGYTPLGAGFHSLGESAAISARASGPDVDWIDAGDDLEFRVGKTLNCLHKLATGHELPYAGMDIQYQCGYAGDYTISISSTNIPNVTVYFDWVAVAEYTIRDITVEQVQDFLTAHTNRRAAEFKDRFTIEGIVGGNYKITEGEMGLGFNLAKADE